MLTLATLLQSENRLQYGATWDLQSGHTFVVKAALSRCSSASRHALKVIYDQLWQNALIELSVLQSPELFDILTQIYNSGEKKEEARNHCDSKLNYIEATCLTPCIRGFHNNLVGYFPNWKHTCTAILWGNKEHVSFNCCCCFYYLKLYLKSLYFLNHTNRQVSVQIHTASKALMGQGQNESLKND